MLNVPVINATTLIVENVIVLRQLSDLPPPDGYVYGPEGGQIGWVWNGTEYVDPNPAPDAVIKSNGGVSVIE